MDGREDRSASTRVSRGVACCAVAGFALYWCAQFVIKPKLGDYSSAYALLQLLVQVGVCAVVVLAAKRARTGKSGIMHRKALLAACAASLLAGMILSFALPFFDFGFGPVAVTVLNGAGFALLLLLWLEVLARQAPDVACVELPIAFLVGNVLTVFLSNSLTGEQSFVAGVAATLCSFSALLVLFRRMPLLCHTPSPYGSAACESSEPLRALLEPLRAAFLGIAVFSFVYGIENELLVHFGSGAEVMGATSLVASVALLGSLAAYAFVAQRPVRLDLLFSVLLPVMGLAVLLNPLVWEGASWVADAIVKTCFLFYQCAFWMAFMYALPRRGAFPYGLFALAAGCSWLCSFVGMALGDALKMLGDSTTVLVTGASMLVLWLCMLGGMLFFRSSCSREDLVGSQEAAAANPGDPFFERVERVSRRCGLSPRETEVFQEYVKGRSAPFIAETLCISEYTVKTHLQRIYAKADVHNRQELLNVFEAFSENE